LYSGIDASEYGHQTFIADLFLVSKKTIKGFQKAKIIEYENEKMQEAKV